MWVKLKYCFTQTNELKKKMEYFILLITLQIIVYNCVYRQLKMET